MKVYATKNFKFEMAHQLKTCKSDDCKNIHGHSYKLGVTITSFGLNKDGMVCDFKIINEIVEPIIKKYDHSFLTIENFGNNPTAENLAIKLWTDIVSKLSEVTGGSVLSLENITLWETDSCYIEIKR